MDTLERLKKDIREADRKYGIYPLVESRVQAKGKAEEMDKQGFGGVVGTVEYNGGFPYDIEAWEKVKAGFEDFISRGMEGIIYDEYGYPSGTARGTVLDNHPEYAAKGAFCYLHFKPLSGLAYHKVDIPEGEFLGAFLVDNQTGKAIDISEARNKSGGLKFFIEEKGEFYLILMVVRTLFEGTHCTTNYCEVRKYISMSDVDATKEFLRVTHENYFQMLGDEFGKGIQAFFTDEPSLIAYTNQPGPMAILPWHEKYPVEFEKAYGYDIREAMCAVLFKRGADCKKRKCDFWEYITKTVAEGYFQTIENWCHEHGVAAAGHCLSEENIQWHIVNYGSLYETMKHFDWPGIDMLGTIEKHLMDECFPFAKLASSVADVYKTGVALSEFSDIKSTYGGSYVSLKEIYRSVHWHIALGINRFVSLYSMQGVSDAELRELNKYVARLNQLMQEGKRECGVAVLYPDMSAWANYTSNGYFYATDPTEDINNLSTTLNKTAWELLHSQIDFNFIDLAALRSGKEENGAFVFNGRSYSSLVLPYCEVLPEDIAGKILDLAQKGVSITFTEKIPCVSRETGGFEEIFVRLKQAVDEGEIRFIKKDDLKTLSQGMQRKQFQLRSGDEIRFERILTHYRKVDENTFLAFVANIGETPFAGELCLDAPYRCVRLDVQGGQTIELGDCDNVSVSLGDGECAVFALIKKGDVK